MNDVKNFLAIDILVIFCEIALRQIPQDFNGMVWYQYCRRPQAIIRGSADNVLKRHMALLLVYVLTRKAHCLTYTSDKP